MFVKSFPKVMIFYLISIGIFFWNFIDGAALRKSTVDPWRVTLKPTILRKNSIRTLERNPGRNKQSTEHRLVGLEYRMSIKEITRMLKVSARRE